MERLISVLRNIEKYEWSDAIFLPENEVWEKETLCLILDPDDVEDDSDEAPKDALDKGLMYALDIQTVEDIVNNYKKNHGKVDDDGLFAAFLYYYDNDAFIE